MGSWEQRPGAGGRAGPIPPPPHGTMAEVTSSPEVTRPITLLGTLGLPAAVWRANTSQPGGPLLRSQGHEAVNSPTPGPAAGRLCGPGTRRQAGGLGESGQGASSRPGSRTAPLLEAQGVQQGGGHGWGRRQAGELANPASLGKAGSKQVQHLLVSL